MNKAEISRDYMERMKAEHAAKPYPAHRHALITGSEKPGSIGRTIMEQMTTEGHLVREFHGDVRDAANRLQAARYLLDTLILSHGVTHLDWFEDAPQEKIEEIFEVNVTASTLLIQNFVRATMDNPYHKTIIIIGSMAHQAVLNGSAAYCAAKAALAHLARCLAWELAPKGYDVFIVHPSNTLGAPMSEETILGLMRYRNLTREAAEAYWGAVLPRDQWLLPEDIAGIVRFLLTPGAQYLSGTQLNLGGGQR